MAIRRYSVMSRFFLGLLLSGVLLPSLFLAVSVKALAQGTPIPMTPEDNGTGRATRVFVLAGQSNAVGYNNVREYQQGKAELPEAIRTQPDILFWDAGKKSWIPLRVGESGGCDKDAFGPEIGFAYNLAKLRPGEQTAIIKCAVGASGIARSSDYQDYIPALKDFNDNGQNWHPPSDGRDAGGLYSRLITQVRAALSALERDGRKCELSGFLWMQGEHEAGISPKMANDYADLLTSLILSVRTDLKTPELPFVVGEINSHTWAFGDIARNGQAKACREVAKVVLVKTVDLPRNGSGGAAHFTADGMIDLGFRFAQAMNQLLPQKGISAPAVESSPVVTLESLLCEMVDRDTIARMPEPRYTQQQASSYNRESTARGQPGWFADSDGLGFIRSEQNGGKQEWVLMEHSGPGCITRMWTPFFYTGGVQNPYLGGPNLRIYLDGSAVPVINEDMIRLIVKGLEGVSSPFAALTTRAGLFILPIPFAKSCKITTDKPPFYNIISYRAYDAGTTVETLTPAVIQRAATAIKESGRKLVEATPAPVGEQLEMQRDIQPGEALTLDLPAGAHAIRRLEFQSPGTAPALLRSLIFKATFDGEDTVWCPLGDFFCAADELHTFKTWAREVSTNGTMLSRYIMPYRQSGRIVVQNLGKESVRVKMAAVVSKWDWDKRSMHFRANWRYEAPMPTLPLRDWNFIAVKGAGVIVGDSWSVLIAHNDWWGEGDEKIYVDLPDNATFPTHFGTGTEDYYGWAGGEVPTRRDEFSHPCASNVRVGGAPLTRGYNICTRERLLDAIPFSRSLELDMEASSGTGSRGANILDQHSGMVYWYGVPGATHNRQPQADDAARPLPTAADLDQLKETVSKNAPSSSRASEMETAEIPYAVPEKPWATGLGHHRAVVHVAEPAKAVAAEIAWRRRDRDADQKNIVIVDAATGQRVTNVARLSISRERGIVAFEPKTAPGDYFVYYMPFAFQGSWGGCDTAYPKPEDTAAAEWLSGSRLDTRGAAADTWTGLPKAKVLRIEARLQFDSFYPMEVVATDAEVKQLLEKNPQPYLLFPEDRRNPIRMLDDLPLKWVRSGPSLQFQGEALRNEYYAFQIGVFASKPVLKNLTIGFSALQSAKGQEIPASAITCLNTQGADTRGKPFTKTLTIAAGKVQPLWCGIDVARDQKPGLYTGTVTIRAEGLESQTVTVALTVSGQVIEDRGDGDLWRHARLRWLNSAAGPDEDLIRPYTALKVKGARIACLGREVALSDGGLPSSVSAGKNEVLAAPARLVVETTAGPLTFQAGKPTFTKKGEARVEWEARSTADAATLTCKGEMEFDGRLRYFVTLKPTAALELKDLRLELPFRTGSARYLMGAGVLGGARPKEHLWKWEGPYDSFWLGSPDAGLQCELRGGSYHGPLLNLYHPAPPPTWGNGGMGGVAIKETAGQVLATAFSGPRQLKAGEEITFEFALIVTPVKPLDPAAHFKTRYWHIEPEAPPKFSLPDPTPEALAAGVNVVNVHQATKRNPYINYPFRSNELITEFTQAMHAKGVKVKLYYTLRELSNYTAELWALRSLGDEVIREGGGGGFAWLREHLVTGYSPAWYSPFPDGSADAAFVNSGESRWYNYYVEGLGWMVKNLGIDGLYLDDVSYDRHTLQRMRRVMERERPGCMIDLHSNTGFSIGPANQYLEFMPYVDRTWFGESFDYNGMGPDQWLVQVSGIPFGVMGEMLANGGNQWRGVLFGMTTRLPWTTNGVRCDPRNVWKVWDAFGIADSKMIGYWDAACPVKTDNPDVLATVYVKKGKALIAVASWAKERVKVKLAVDWKALGLDPAKARLHAPLCERFQPAGEFAPDAEIPVDPGRGWMFVLDEKPAAEIN